MSLLQIREVDRTLEWLIAQREKQINSQPGFCTIKVTGKEPSPRKSKKVWKKLQERTSDKEGFLNWARKQTS